MADAALGLTRIRNWRDPKSRVEIVASHAEDKPILYANAIAIGPKTGNIYFTDSTDIPPDRILHRDKKTKRKHYLWDTLYASKWDLIRGRAQGRVCEYSPKTDQVRVLAEGIQFANGIGVDMEKEEFLVVAETFGVNVLRYDLGSVTRSTAPLDTKLEPTVLVPQQKMVGYIDNLDCAWHKGKKQTLCYAAVINEYAKPHKFWRKLPEKLQLVLRTLLMLLPRSMAPKVVPTYTAVLVVDPLHPNDYRYIQDPSGEDMVLIAGVTVDPVDHSKLYLGSLTNKYVGVYLTEDDPMVTSDASNSEAKGDAKEELSRQRIDLVPWHTDLFGLD